MSKFWQGAVLAACVFMATPILAQAPDQALMELIASSDRSPQNSARDKYRHPAQVLAFFGVKPDSKVVEILPGGGGYWTEILAPFLKDKGHYIAANGDQASNLAEIQRDNAAFNAKFVDNPARFGALVVTQFSGDRFAIAAPDSADFVLTFRNVHNWMSAGEADAAFRTFFRALKSGGVLGIEEHRAGTDQPQDPLAKSGYVREDYVMALAETAGFKFAGKSDVLANPKDTKDYSVGVWALPPSFRLKDVDRDKFAEIGESDRMVLKFIKP